MDHTLASIDLFTYWISLVVNSFSQDCRFDEERCSRCYIERLARNLERLSFECAVNGNKVIGVETRSWFTFYYDYYEHVLQGYVCLF